MVLSRRALAWLPAGLWMAVIFSLSAQPRAESSAQSGPVASALLAVLNWALPGSLEPGLAPETLEAAEHLLRKTAHFLAYLVLGVLTARAWWVARGGTAVKDNGRGGGVGKRRDLGAIAGPLAVCVVYAASDELHQLLVPGRSGEFGDVLLDSLGALAGVL